MNVAVYIQRRQRLTRPHADADGAISGGAGTVNIHNSLAVSAKRRVITRAVESLRRALRKGMR
jgi:hypothetical protein